MKAVKIVVVVILAFAIGWVISSYYIRQSSPEYKARMECLAKGDIWRREGLAGNYRCTHYYKDAGRLCESSNECEGDCVVYSHESNGAECEENDSPFGCSARIEDCKIVNGERNCTIVCSD